jgi:hypothetical protein
MDKNICILVYTHSDYSFIWEPMIFLLKKYVKNTDIHWLYDTNAPNELIKKYVPASFIKHTYNENDIWTKRVYNCLKNINNEYVLFIHDDWFPINTIHHTILESMIQFMKNNNCDFLLSYSHITTTSNQDGIFSGFENYYFYKEDNHIFQPAIWYKSVFEEFCFTLNKRKDQNEDNDCLEFMRNKKCYSVQNIKTVTRLRTTNSLFFPHMHVLSQGLWNFDKYPTLKCLLDVFNVDTESRGIHSWWELDTQ